MELRLARTSLEKLGPDFSGHGYITQSNVSTSYLCSGRFGSLNSPFSDFFWKSWGPTFSGRGYITQNTAVTSYLCWGRFGSLNSPFLGLFETFSRRSPVGARVRVPRSCPARQEGLLDPCSGAPSGERLQMGGRFCFRLSCHPQTPVIEPCPGDVMVQTQVTAQGGWGRRPKGEAPRSEAGALGARWLSPARPQPPRSCHPRRSRS